MKVKVRDTTVVLWAGVLTWAVLGCGTVQADLILGNTFGPPYLSGTIFNDGRTLKGVGLEMKAGQTYAVDRFSVELEYLSGAPQITGHIYANDDPFLHPQQELLRMNTIDVVVGTAVYDFVPGSPFVLQAGQKYWFIISDGPSAGWVRWTRHDPSQAPSGDPANFIGYTFSENGGTTWEASAIFNNLQIHGTYVPAPVLGLWVLAGGLVGRRRR